MLYGRVPTVAAIVAIALSACATPQQRMERAVRDYGPACELIGLERGTKEWGQCIVTSYQAQRDRDTAVGMALIGAGAALSTPPPRQPAPVTCYTRGPWTTCQ